MGKVIESNLVNSDKIEEYFLDRFPGTEVTASYEDNWLRVSIRFPLLQNPFPIDESAGILQFNSNKEKE